MPVKKEEKYGFNTAPTKTVRAVKTDPKYNVKTAYGSTGLTNEQAANEAAAQVARFSVPAIKSGSPVVSSSDRTGEFNQLSSDIDNRDIPVNDVADTGDTTPAAPTDPNATGYETGDSIIDSQLRANEQAIKDAEAWATDQQDQINRLLPRTLAAIDDQYKASTMNIQATYSKLIDSQIAINKIDKARVSAYGVQSGGQYVPLEFTKAISKQEQKNANAIASLENERNALLATAKAARTEGRVSAMRDNLQDLRDVEEQMRERVSQLQKDVEARYELILEARDKKEAEHLESVNKALQRAAFAYLDDFEDAKDPEAAQEVINQIIKDSGGLLTPDDTFDIYTQLSGASRAAKDQATQDTKDELDIKKKRADIANTYDTINKRKDGNKEDEDKANVFADLNEFFALPNEDGNPTIGDDGKANPDRFKEALRAAKEDGVNRASFLAEYGHLVNLKHYEDYGLTQAEKDKLEGN